MYVHLNDILYSFAKKKLMTKKFTNSFIFAIAIAILFTACGGSTKTTETAATESAATEVTYKVDTENSVVAWKGEVAGVYGHNGVINISNGTITAKGDQITGGSVTIDMTTIQPLDSASYSAEHPASDLVGHLSTGDFFLVEEFPTSSFVIKSFDGTKLTGDLTVRGITKEVTADVTSISATETGLEAAATLVFNRQDFKVSWVHYMKDMILSDDITLNINIKAGI